MGGSAWDIAREATTTQDEITAREATTTQDAASAREAIIGDL
ncbi:hypothetical protein [Candidatus Epulonipiscium viviparus]|nr:hypothetical protein [Candidatus Epulopiscium viviparus]